MQKGQHIETSNTQADSIIKTADSLRSTNPDSTSVSLPFAIEAAWMTGSWETLKRLLSSQGQKQAQDFNG